jgi:hypothetical protein
VTNLPFADNVDASPSIQLSSHNVVISFRKRDHKIWDVLPGAAAKKKKKSKGEEEHSNSSASPCTPSGDAASSELYLGGKKEAADPTSKAPTNRKVVVIEEESEEEEDSSQALMQRKSKSADTEFSEAAPTKSLATSGTRVLIEELVGSEEEEDDLQKTANGLGPPKADRAHNSNGKQASKGKASDVVAAEKSSGNEEKARKTPQKTQNKEGGGGGGSSSSSNGRQTECEDVAIAAVLAYLRSLQDRAPVDKLTVSRLAVPIAAKCVEGDCVGAFMALRDALPHLGAVMSAADRTKLMLNAQDRNGDTPLHAAVKSSKWQCAGKLVELGACIWVRNSDGKMPLC